MNILNYQVNHTKNELELEVVFNGTTYNFPFCSQEAMRDYCQDKLDFILKSLGFEQEDK